MKARYDATLIGIADANHEGMQINPDLNASIAPGSVIYYIADERVMNFSWSELSV